MFPNRMKRVNTLLQQEISNIVRREMQDPRVGFATISEVRVSADMSSARVYVSVMDTDERRNQAIKGLTGASNFIRSRLRETVTLKRIPELNFYLDNSIERGVRLSRLIDEMAKDLPPDEPEEEQPDQDIDEEIEDES